MSNITSLAIVFPLNPSINILYCTFGGGGTVGQIMGSHGLNSRWPPIEMF